MREDLGRAPGMYGTDQASYLAEVRRPLGKGFVESRSPYGARRLNSWVVRAVTEVVPITASAGFLVVSIVASFAALLGLFSLYRHLAVPPAVAAVAALGFVMIPRLWIALRAPVYVDIGLWAFMIWSAERWGREKHAQALVLLGLGVLWHESALILGLAFACHCLFARRRDFRLLVAVGVVCAVTFLGPRLAFPSSASYDWSEYLQRAFRQRVLDVGRPRWFTWLFATAGYGAGAVLVMALPGLRRLRESAYGFLLAMLPGTAVLLIFFDDRNLPPAAILVGTTAMALWLSDKHGRVTLVAGVAMVVSWAAFATAYLAGTLVGTACVLALVLGAAAVVYAERMKQPVPVGTTH